MTESDDTRASFQSGFTCSSAVFSAFSDELGLDPDKEKKIACGFLVQASQKAAISVVPCPGRSW
jgi:uncharacterized protein YycO